MKIEINYWLLKVVLYVIVLVRFGKFGKGLLENGNNVEVWGARFDE